MKYRLKSWVKYQGFTRIFQNVLNVLPTFLLFIFLLGNVTETFAEIKTEQAMSSIMLFQDSIRNGQLDNVRMMLSEKMMDPNQSLDGGIFPLHVAVINNQEAVVAVLIQAGANVNAQDPTTLATPLHLSAVYGRDAILKLLLQKGANVNALMKMGITPLMVATQFNHPQTAEILLKNKANVNQADEEGFTALHFAAQTGDEITAQVLIKHGARLDARDRLHATPLTVATDNKKEGMMRLLSNSATLQKR